MPKQPMNYANAVIYKIVCNDLTITDCYVGSTTNFTKRKHQHKCHCKNRNQPIYEFIRANSGWDNWSMILVEEFPTTSKLLVDQRERYWIETLNANLNSYIPARTKLEYYQDNRIEIAEQQKQYNQDHKIQKKQYQLDNKVQIAERKKQYYQNNKVQISERRKHIYAMAQLHNNLKA